MSFRREMENSDVNKRELQPSTLLHSEDVRWERALSLRHSHSGHLGSLTKAQNEIGIVAAPVEKRQQNSANVTSVKDKFDHYEILWKNFVLSHNKFMDVTEPEEQAESAECFDILAQQRISLSTSIEKFICDTVTRLNEWVMEDLQKMTVIVMPLKQHLQFEGAIPQIRGRKGSTGSCVCGTRETAES